MVGKLTLLRRFNGLFTVTLFRYQDMANSVMVAIDTSSRYNWAYVVS